LTILLDESVPRLIKTRLTEFSIVTVQEIGWSGMKNGELLAAASQQFTIFITADKKLRYQQNLTDNRLSIIVLSTNQVPLVITLLSAIQETLPTIQPGDLIEHSLP
jgi:predicted nuclease of predicted toxin-antitoxin system